MTYETMQVYSGSPVTPEELLCWRSSPPRHHFVSDDTPRRPENLAEWTTVSRRSPNSQRGLAPAIGAPEASSGVVARSRSTSPVATWGHAPAVEHDGLAGEVAGVLTQQERHRRPDVELGVADATERAEADRGNGLLDRAGVPAALAKSR